MRVELVERQTPLSPAAVVARGRVSHALVERLSREEAARLTGLSAVAGVDLLIVLGEAETLPWADGVEYLGREPEAPALFLPTGRRANVPAALLEAALRRTHGHPSGGLALCWRDGPAVVSLADARKVSREALSHWRRGP